MTASHNSDEIVNFIAKTLGDHIVVGLPLGLGKANHMINVLYRYACEHPELQLTIVTALTLEVPKAKSDLQQRLLGPIVERLYAGYPELEYALARRRRQLPNNVRVVEFFLAPGSLLGSRVAQTNYISSNYTHVARDMIDMGINLVLQMVSPNKDCSRYSLSCNPDVTVDLVPMMREQDYPSLVVGESNSKLPFLYGSADVPPDYFDVVYEATAYTLFSTPKTAVSVVDHAIGLYASSLIVDGGTLQLGIGSLGDALVNALLLRHKMVGHYQAIMNELLSKPQSKAASEKVGAVEPFQQGLYGATEMFTDGFLHLIEGDILTREVIDDVELQEAINRGEAEMPEGEGIVLHGGFYLGPESFYQSLRDLPETLRKKIRMIGVGRINQLHGSERLDRAQRPKARFVNSCLMATLNGAIVSDGLENGQVISGVGGQYNFVAMAHALEDGRSILKLRATREAKGKVTSNIVLSYGHCTIPRHLRDMVVTEYGIADLRGKTDQEVIVAMLNIADSRFQEDLRLQAVAAGKLDPAFRIADIYLHNTPEQLATALAAYVANGCLDPYPLGSSFTDIEKDLVRAATLLKDMSHDKPRTLLFALQGLLFADAKKFSEHLSRLGFEKNGGLTRAAILSALDKTSDNT